MAQLVAPQQDDDQDQQFSTLARLLSGFKMARDAAAAESPNGGGGTPTGSPSPTPAPAPAPVQATAPDQSVPNVPKYVAPDMARRQALEAAVNRPAPMRADYKPSVLDRIFGGLTGFGAGLQHNPNAVEIGSDITNKKFGRATADWDTQHAQASEQLGQLDRDTRLGQQDWENQMQVFQGEMTRAREGREQKSADALAAERTAKAGKYDYQSMSPEDRAVHLPDLEKQTGITLSDDERKAFIFNGQLPKEAKPEKEDLNPEHVILGNIKDPVKRAQKAQDLYNQAHREPKGDNPDKPLSQSTIRMINEKKTKGLSETEDWYQKEYANSVKPLYDAIASSKPIPGMDLNASRAARQKAASDADEQLKGELNKRKQSVQDSYENDIQAQGKGAQHVEFNGKPQQQTTAKAAPADASRQKIATKDDVQAYASRKGIPYDKAEAAFRGSGYDVK
jgi:hypothetical protein